MLGPIQRFSDMYGSSPELASVLENPMVDPAQRDAILEEVAQRVGLTGSALNAVRLLALVTNCGPCPGFGEARCPGRPKRRHPARNGHQRPRVAGVLLQKIESEL